MADQPSITHATKEDVAEILAMIQELADYEKASSEVKATQQSLLDTLTLAPFSEQNKSGFAKTLILRLPEKPSNADDQPGAVAGMALYFNNYSTWRSKPGIYLEDLFVRPQYRKRGFGKLLLQALAKEVISIDGGRLEWSCLTWNTPSLNFYESIGAKQMEGWIGLRVDGDALHKLASGTATQNSS